MPAPNPMMGMGGPAPMPPMGGPVPGAPTPAPAPPMGQPPMDAGPNPAEQMLLESMLEELQAEIQEEIKPRYKYGFDPKKIRKPTVEAVRNNADEIRTAHQKRLDRHADTLNRLRMAYAGVFETDVEARKMKQQEAFYLSELVDEMDAMTAVLAGIDIAWNKPCTHPDLKQDTQKIEDFTYYLREKEEYQWHCRGRSPLKIAEARDLLTFGFLVSRRTIDVDDPTCPFTYELLDPSTVFWVPGGKRGMKAVYHVYTTTLEEVLGEFTKDGIGPATFRDQLNPKKMQRFGDAATVEVIDYWDEWYHCVLVDGVPLVTVTAHKLGEVPFVFGFGPGGESPHIRFPHNTNYLNPMTAIWEEELAYKCVSYVEYKKRNHDQKEAFLARALAGYKKTQNPPIIFERSVNAQDAEMPDIDGNEGGVNETVMGEEKISGFPTSPPATETQILSAAMAENDAMSFLPKGMYGDVSKSNVSGTAMSNYLNAGWEKIAPWVMAMEQYHTACGTFDIRAWRNFGHLARYTGEDETPFYVPARNPSGYDAQSFELTPDVIDRAGWDVTCKMVRSRRSEWVQLANAAVIMHDQLGIADKEFIAEEVFGFTDALRKIEKTRGDKIIEAIFSDPDFGKTVLAEDLLLQRVEEAKGNPELMQLRVEQYRRWVEKNGVMAQQAQPGMAPGGPPQPGGPQPMGGIPGGPNTAAAMGQGPGSVTGVQGGPQGPTAMQGNPMAGGM
jgi:hypothetical protein